MPSDNLTPSEGAILLVLLAESREVSNSELSERFGMTLTGASREKLNALGYVDSRKEGRGFVHALSDAGWARCAEPMNFAKVRPLALGAALTVLVTAIHRDLERSGRSLAMMFAPADDAAPKQTIPVAAQADLTEQIRLTYKQFAPEPGAWVNIADIRETLSAVGRDEMDAALRELEQQRDVNIVPQANEKALSERTRGAAVIIGRQHKHFIAIGV
jgi:hypothetical protein